MPSALAIGLAAGSVGALRAQGEAAPTWRADVVPLFEAHCVRCHGPEQSKGGITVHTLGSDLAQGYDLERWEQVLDMLESGEMPPDDQPQPTAIARDRAARWIDGELRAFVEASKRADAAPTARRLTNAEYHHTMRDLLGVELDVTRDLPEDPTRPYRFRNSARYMLLGLENLDRYEEAARRAMRSVIVDPKKPRVHTKRQAWGRAAQRGMPDPTGMQSDELGVFGNRNRTVANGMRVFERPETGAFRIRIKASAILPPGFDEVPLQVMMGYDIVGVGVQPSSPAAPVGTLLLTNSVDEPQVFELTGRVENFPWKPEHRFRRGGRIDGRLVIEPPHFAITPVNVFDDGTLNDRPDPLTRPRAVVEWIEFEAPIAEPWPPAHHTRILFPSPLRDTNPSAYVAEVLRRFLPRAFRRPVAEDEVTRFVRVYEIVAERLGDGTIEQAMRETLAMVLISPDFLYRNSAAQEAVERQFQLASRLSYFLWCSMPDDVLFAAAAAGRLDDPAEIERQARRMLDDPRAADFVEDFASQWLALHKLWTVPIALDRFPRFLYTIQRGERAGREVPHRPTIRDHMFAETLAFVGELIRRNASLLELVDADFAMLNAPLAAHYGVDGVRGHALRPVPLGDHPHLGGLLTQGSILVGTSTGAVPQTIYRAVWLREAILGDEVRDPPADVPALEESAGDAVESAVTLVELLAQHRQDASCAECHDRLDPWGIPFEKYDATGRFAPRVPPEGTRVLGFDAKAHGDLDGYRAYLEDIATVDVASTIRVPHGPEVDGMAALKRHLLEERRHDIAGNLTRRLLTYALGRELTYRDRYAVQQMVDEARANDYRLRDLMVTICRSDLFRTPTR